MTKTIYLSGGIKDLSSEEQNDWRDIMTKELYPRFNILNPLYRNFRDNEFQSAQEICQLDKYDIISSDILIANATKPSWGTSQEILFAWMKHKIIVVFTGKEFQETSPWIVVHSTRVCRTMEECISYIKKYF